MCNHENLNRLGYYLRGTCGSISSALRSLDIKDNGEDWSDELLNVSTEKCRGCAWWFESCELVDVDDDENQPGYCDQCRGTKDDDDD